jgi:hypothetical protein
VSLSAKKLYWDQVLADIQDRFGPQFHDLAVETVIYYLPGEICELSSAEERKAVIDSIPDDCSPAHAKQLIINGTRVLWKKRNVGS